ncbi:MAG: porin [Rhodospirillales bacterium]
MKKVLTATTALAAPFILTSIVQAAEPITLSVGGYMEQYVGISTQDSDYVDNNRTTVDEELVGMHQDAEIHFSGETQLDNGVTVGAMIELVGTSAGGLDETYIWLSSPTLGTLQLGDTINVANVVHHTAPDVGIDHADGDVSTWISAASVTNNQFTSISNKGAKINYLSPSFGGFGVGAFYQPDSDTVGSDGGYTARTTKDPIDTVYGAAVFFDGEVRPGVTLHGDLGYAIFNSTAAGTGTGGNSETEVFQIGVSLVAGGLTLGAGYLNQDQTSTAGTTSDVTDGYTAAMGAAYSTGPYSISLSGIVEEYEGSSAISANDETISLMLSANYNLGPGVDLAASLVWAEFADESTNKGSSNEGYAFVTGVELTF